MISRTNRPYMSYNNDIMLKKNKENKTAGKINHKPSKLSLAIIFLMALLGAVTAACLVIFESRIRSLTAPSEESSSYRHHYAFVGDRSSSFDARVFASAQKAGEETGDYVEFLGSDLEVTYSKNDLMKIAVASKVDGIIVSADDTEDMTERIYEADKAGIPVVCVGTDCIGSARKSYVGASYFTLGQEYGKLMVPLAGDTPKNVLVLMSPNEQSKSQNIIYSGIRDYLNKSNASSNFVLKTQAVGNGTMFSSEESITDLFGGNDLPDILVCLDETDTTAACQSIVDYNKVGSVVIYGYSSNDTILHAIDRGVITASLAIDVPQIGSDSVACLDDFYSSGFANEYVSIDIKTIDASNAAQMIAEADSSDTAAADGNDLSGSENSLNSATGKEDLQQ